MNERMYELLAQARNQPVDVVKRWPHGSAILTPAQLKKYTKLIVAECMEACSRANDIKHFVPPTQEQVVLSCMREIETTFRS